jgi:hypothetical protein
MAISGAVCVLPEVTYTHLFNTGDHADAMAALGAMASTRTNGKRAAANNVVPFAR